MFLKCSKYICSSVIQNELGSSKLFIIGIYFLIYLQIKKSLIFKFLKSTYPISMLLSCIDKVEVYVSIDGIVSFIIKCVLKIFKIR